MGFLLDLEVRGNRIELTSAAEIDNYMLNKHLDADDDWFVFLLNEHGETIGSLRAGNPGRLSPILSAMQPVPLTIKIPRLQGLAEAVIYNQYHEALLRIPVDGSFKTEASANRQRFLVRDRENRRLLAANADMRRASAVRGATRADRAARYQDLPEELQRQYTEEIRYGIEKLEQFGPEIMNLQRELRVEPEELERELVRESPLFANSTLSAETPRRAGAFTLSGQVLDCDSGTPIAGATLDFYQYDTSGKYIGYLGRKTSDTTGGYLIPVDAGSVTIIENYLTLSSKRYMNRQESVGINGNTTWIIKGIPGVLLSGIIANAQGQGVGGATVSLYSKELKTTTSSSTDSTGGYSVVIPGNRPLNVSLSVPSPYTPPPSEMGLIFAADTVRNFQVIAGWLASGTVTGDSGIPIARAAVLLRQLNSTTTSCPYWYANTDNNGKYAFAVPKNLTPNTFVMSAFATNYLLQSAGLEITGDAGRDFQLLKGNEISGLVRNDSEQILSGARIRAYQGGMLVTSALSTSSGTYSFSLSSGVYEFETLPPSGSAFAPATSKNVSVTGNATFDFVLAPAAGILTVKVYFPDQESYNRIAARTLFRFELYQMGLTVYATSGVLGPAGLDFVRNKYYRSFTLYVNKGRYDLTAFVMGCRPTALSGIEISDPVTASLDVPAPFLWSGVLRGADGTPLANQNVQTYNDLINVSQVVSTDASGRFSILMTPNGFAKFFTDTGSGNILHTERFENVTASRNEDCILDSFPPIGDTGATLTQLYGLADRGSRWNLVMIGDGYTGVRETYTDTNANGQWDGALYYDLNHNGIWDSGEPYQRYGNAAAPVSGQNPLTKNEPFVDLNGDGVPNLRDQELFDLNTLDTTRSLFGQDEWWKHRDAFNLFRIRLVSIQAGHKLFDTAGKLILDRDTALGTYLNTPERSWLFNANYTLVSQYINQYVPECDTRIVMVNQPIRMGRVNSYMFQYGGDVPTLCNDYVVAHEMGHNVGLLADEYTEYQETFKGSESSTARNVTAFTNPDRVPWRHLISPDKEIPSVPGSRGVGLYEGAGYYTGGLYRPTEYCMMVSGNRYCPVCSEQIELRLREITAEVPKAVPRSPSQTVIGLFPVFNWDALSGVSHYLFELEKADGSQAVASFDVYDTTFTLPFVLSPDTEYRWRIRPGSNSRWGAWSPWTVFRLQSPAPAFTAVFAHIAAGGGYQTTLTGINTSQVPVNLLVSPYRSDGTPFSLSANGYAGPVPLILKPMGTARINTDLSGNTVAGYALLAGDAAIGGTALFKIASGSGVVLSEAAVGLSKPAQSHTVYIDYVDNAVSGYAVANFGGNPANIMLTLRDAAGNAQGVPLSLVLPAGQHFARFAHEHFGSIRGNFEGTMKVSADQNLAVVALRFDNLVHDVFSTIPVSVDSPGTTLYFPQVADGGGYRTNFILLNPGGAATSAVLDFFSSDGTPLTLTISGVSKTSHSVPLSAKGATRFVTDGTPSDVRVGWVRVTCPTAITGSSIFQTRADKQILSEAGVGASPLARHLVTYVESSATTQSGLAVCNPNSSPVELTLKLRNPTGDIVAATTATLPADGHIARFFTEWFPHGFGDFEGTLEVLAAEPVSAVALRYDNPRQNVFATLPVMVVP